MWWLKQRVSVNDIPARSQDQDALIARRPAATMGSPSSALGCIAWASVSTSAVHAQCTALMRASQSQSFSCGRARQLPRQPLLQTDGETMPSRRCT